MSASPLMIKGAVMLAIGGAGLAVVTFPLRDGVHAAEPPPGVAATRGTLVVAVGGVGQVVESKAVEAVTLPGSAGATGSTGSSTTQGSGDAVFPRVAGHVSGFLVVPGQRVTASQPLAKIDDGGAAAAAIRLAKHDLAVAELELRQKRAGNATLGPVPSAADLAAGRAAVNAARATLARALAGPTAPDISTARLELRRAEADLEALRGGGKRARTEAIRVARQNLAAAKSQLRRTLRPANPADLSAARAELRKAEAELASLQKAAQPATPESLKAANQAVAAAQQKLAKASGPRDPLPVLTAEAELTRAEADLAALLRTTNPAPPDEEIKAAEAAVNAAKLKRDQAKAPPDPADVAAAQHELDRAVAELAALQRPAPAPLPKQIEAAKAAVESAKLKLARLQRGSDPADVAAARLAVDAAKADLRARRAPAATPSALEAARQAVRTAKTKLNVLLGPARPSDVAAARFDVRRTEAELQALQARFRPSETDVGLAELKVDAAVAALARARLAKKQLMVRAPRAGRVTALLTVPGAPVDSTTPIAGLADLGNLAVKVDLSEFDVAQVKPGLKAAVAVDALGGKTYPGRVEFAALTGSNAGGVVTFPVRVGLERTTGLRPGMNVSVRIVVARRPDVVQVPLDAVLRDDEDRPFVNVVTPSGETAEREVQLGLANNRNVEIVEGLEAGERVEVAESEPEEEA